MPLESQEFDALLAKGEAPNEVLQSSFPLDHGQVTLPVQLPPVKIHRHASPLEKQRRINRAMELVFNVSYGEAVKTLMDEFQLKVTQARKYLSWARNIAKDQMPRPEELAVKWFYQTEGIIRATRPTRNVQAWQANRLKAINLQIRVFQERRVTVVHEAPGSPPPNPILVTDPGVVETIQSHDALLIPAPDGKTDLAPPDLLPDAPADPKVSPGSPTPPHPEPTEPQHPTAAPQNHPPRFGDGMEKAQ